MTAAEHLARMRQEYSDAGVREADLAPDWLTQFRRWFAQAEAAGVIEPNAMVLATADAHGEVSSRSVLAKQVDVDGVTFYTNYESAKSRAMAENPHVSATFPWYGLHRQIHVRGVVEKVSRATTEAYWALRPRGSQIGSWASPQSTVIADRHALDEFQRTIEVRFGGLDGTESIPAPPHWGGWLIRPQSVEFWQGRRNRLHDRLRYRRDGDGWVIERLAS